MSDQHPAKLDGNTILVVWDVGFRVYRALLAAQSTVFADTFASSSSRTDESYAGCPLVHLSPSPEDLRLFLRVLIPKTKRLFFPEREKSGFPQVYAVVRLAHRYIVEDALLQGISALKAYYADDFESFLKSSCTGELPIDLFQSHCEPIGAVNLARLIDMPSLLPAALYDCCGLDGDVLDGYITSAPTTFDVA
ncbi:hypothetical protein C8Q80DRAFT_1273052 [Daedaleopsis nitida]|nr:hypothetical protein C8Q80DRAFT_1273052 [Daedaleopsis nitida]